MRPLSPEEGCRLLAIARASIRHGLATGQPLRLAEPRPVGPLAEPGGCFVTLTLGEDLRGCIGSLQAVRPLAEDVAENAFAAAFRDPRFPPLSAAEENAVHLHLSVLSPPEPLRHRDEADLLAQLRPHEDGLIIACGQCRATFLPLVWKQLPEPADFLAALKRKAGLPAGEPCPNLQAWRYRTQGFEENARPAD